MVAWLTDVSPAHWVADRLHPFAQDTGSVVPEGFEAYGRLLHPIGPRRQRWADMASRHGKVVHAEMQFHLLGRVPGDDPTWGSLPVEERAALVDLLRPYTTTPDRCWLAAWEGSGVDDGGVDARLELPNRSYLLAGGSVELASASVLPRPMDQSYNLWWPQDRSWLVSTEVDYAWTYVGGTRALVDELLVDGRLEVLEARLTDRPFYDSDVLNAALS